MSIFEPRRESLSREDRLQLQLERLQALLARLRRNVPRHRKNLGTFQVTSLDDLNRIPLMSPADLAAAFPYGMFALPRREVIRLHSTIGPGGMQMVIGHTQNDLANWGRLAARQLVASGATAHDLIQISFAGSTFGQALGHMLGAQLIEASMIPQDAFHTEYQLTMMQNYRPSVLIATPTQARDLIDLMEQRGIDPQSTPLRTVFLSRPIPPEERAALKTGLFADIHCIFSVPEILDPGLTVECEHRHFHVNEDHFLIEVVEGELVVTTLTREAMPLLRYRTRIAGELEDRPCPCGRTGRIVHPGRRLDGRLRVNEMPLYRNQVDGLMSQTRAAGHPFLATISETQIRVFIRVSHSLFPDTVREFERLKIEVESEFQTKLGVRAVVGFLTPAEFDRRKAEEPPDPR